MALSGTLKDFGIADILQLIGHQSKTGRLVLKSGSEEIDVLFIEGNVIFASEKDRKERNMLGSLLLRAELLSKERLQAALQVQGRTLKRLGDILVEQGAVSPPQLAQMMRLQTTETLYRLFAWKTGSYEFEPEDVDRALSAFEPIRAESILLEGFRRLDEWPALKKKVPWDDVAFATEKDLDTSDAPALDQATGGGDGEEGRPGASHKIVYRLAAEGRSIQQVIDASRLGEFEARKAFDDLITWGYLRPQPTSKLPAQRRASPAPGLGRTSLRLGGAVALVGAAVALVVLAAPKLAWSRATTPARRGAIARVLAGDQLLRLEHALEVYRAEQGEYPKDLDQLVDKELVTAQDVHYPYGASWFYRRTQQGFVLLPPLD